MMALKGGRADSELKRLRKEKRLRAPLQLPLFTSPLEADRTGNGKVCCSDMVPHKTFTVCGAVGPEYPISPRKCQGGLKRLETTRHNGTTSR